MAKPISKKEEQPMVRHVFPHNRSRPTLVQPERTSSDARMNSILHEVRQMDTPSRIGSRRSGNSKQDSLSCDAARMETLEKVDVRVRALPVKIDWDVSRSLITTIRGVGACRRCQRISRCIRRRSPATNEESFMLRSRIFHVERL